VAGSLKSRAKECSGGHRYSGQEHQADESFHNQIIFAAVLSARVLEAVARPFVHPI
jgi:hypothetical protein